jgi:hypothetical protein
MLRRLWRGRRAAPVDLVAAQLRHLEAPVEPGEAPAYDGPKVAYLRLEESPPGESARSYAGRRIMCRIIEDPHRDKRGMRVFWAEPEREPERWETVYGMYVDTIPARSTVMIRFPCG